MVKIGFICEGKTEAMILSSSLFIQYCSSINLEITRVIDAGGSGNLLPHNCEGFIATLEKEGSQKIIILTDLDSDVCITKTKERINPRSHDVVVLAVRQIEAWFLASTSVMRIF